MEMSMGRTMLQGEAIQSNSTRVVEPKNISEMATATDILDERICVLGNLINELGEMISSALRPPVPQPTKEDGKAMVECKSRLTEWVDGNSRKINDMISTVRDYMQRCTL